MYNANNQQLIEITIALYTSLHRKHINCYVDYQTSARKIYKNLQSIKTNTNTGTRTHRKRDTQRQKNNVVTSD